MTNRTRWLRMLVAVLAGSAAIPAQTLTNQSLSGKYFFRHVYLGTDINGNLTGPGSLIGAMTFDGAGHYSYTAQQVLGNNAATSQTGSGAYSVAAAGFVSLDNPLNSGAKVNARMGPEALLGSSTESAGTSFDLFVAIPAPTAGAALSGPYWTVTLELPGASMSNVRNTIFSLATTSIQGQFASFAVSGHAANISGGAPTTQQVTGAAYTMGADGTGTAQFGAPNNSVLLSGNRTLYVSADGNVILGGSTAAGAHDILVGVKAASGATAGTWSGNYWAAGLRVDPGDPGQAPVLGYAGSAAARGQGNLYWTKRFKALGNGAFDYTGVNAYALNADGSATVQLSQAGLGAGAKAFVGSVVSANDPGYEIYLGAQMTPLSGTGVFLDPQKVVNAASYAPAGNPISPGEFIALFGTGLAKSSLTAKPPYPLTLNGVTVTVNGQPAPLYYVSAGQINALVPYGTQGPSAAIVVQNGANSNTVTVPVAATAPGIFSGDSSGAGAGAVLHANFTPVNAASPAAAGETVLVYLTGMGAVSPPVPDGTAGGTSPLSNVTAAPIYVYVGGQQATPSFSGLAPGYPGLYQINVQIPTVGPGAIVPLAISTPNAFQDQVSIPVQ